MAKLPPHIRAPPMDFEEAKSLAKRVRESETPEFDLVEVFGASGALVKGFDSEGYSYAEPFDVRPLLDEVTLIFFPWGLYHQIYVEVFLIFPAGSCLPLPLHLSRTFSRR